MERPDWMPETHLNRLELVNLMVCICYHCIKRFSSPDATPEEKQALPQLMNELIQLLSLW